MKLVIVESPTKCRTLSRFLGKEYQLEATMGHIRDLPKSELGVEIKKGFKPTWAIVPGREKEISQLKKAFQKAEKIYLATDPDREGESIAWHTAQVLVRQFPHLANSFTSEVKSADTSEVSPCRGVSLQRIVFHEITAEAIKKALENPRSIDMNLVQAQKARRILDRLVGYKLSPLLWRKVRRGLSAGRVQSVAVRLIVEREREIEKFISEEYWRVFAALSKNKSYQFFAELVEKSGEKYSIKKSIKLFSGTYTFSKTNIVNESQAEVIIKDLASSFIVNKVEKKETLYYPPSPFITSTLQQTAGQRFGWSGRMTMKLAQNLYERGLITYHRTDSINLAVSAVQKIRRYLIKNFPDEYLPQAPRIYKTKSKLAQEAHEAIRPTNIEVKGLRFKASNRQAKKLYDLIWRRTIACQMNPARLEKTHLEISCGDYLFASQGLRMLFNGFLKVYPLTFSENILPSVKEGDRLDSISLGAIRNMTSPPPRYTEASLIKTLEKEGIGRPSTYAPIISLIQLRQYVEKIEGKFQPTNLGETVNDFLVKNFSDVVDIPFTAQMEDGLDQIAKGEKKWLGVLQGFWPPFDKKLNQVAEKAKRVKIAVEKIGEKCPKCNHDLIVRIGKFGKFIACSNFPECKYTRPFIEKVEGVKCPKCGAEIIIRKTKKGKQFYGCSNYPQCDWASWRKPKN